MSSERANAILAKFPGPVTLSASRRKWLLMLVGSGAFTAAGIALVLSSATAGGWFGVIFFGLCTIVAVVMLLPGAGALRLDREGFEVTSLFRRHRSRWADATGFKSAQIPPSFIHLVAYDDANLSGKSLAKLNVVIAGANAGLPDTYGLAAADLAELMTRWRERALTPQ